MLLDTGTIIGIIIASLSSITVMSLFWQENSKLTKQVRRLQVALRDERRITK
jgi:hypothetical protein